MYRVLFCLILLVSCFSVSAGTISKKKSDRKIVLQVTGDSLSAVLESKHGPLLERNISLDYANSLIDYRAKQIKRGYKFNYSSSEEVYDYNQPGPHNTPYGNISYQLTHRRLNAGAIIGVPMTIALETMFLPISLPSRLIRNGSVNKDLKLLKKVLVEGKDIVVNKRRFARIAAYLNLLYDRYNQNRDSDELIVHWENYNRERN